MTTVNSTTVLLDDTDPALVYSGSWYTSAPAESYNTTSHGTRTNGASMQFTFRGTFVAVYGTVGLDAPISSYTLDGTTTIHAAGRLDAPINQQLLYNSPALSDGEHTLIVTEIDTGALWIDYILYVPSVSSLTSSSLSPSTMPSRSPMPTSSTVIPTPSPTPSGTGPPGQVNSNSKSSIPVSAVAGGAIGALVLIIGLIFGVLYYRKRAKRLAGARLLEKENILSDSSELDKTGPDAVITPFTRVYTSGPDASSGYKSSNANMHPPGPAYLPSEYDHQHRRHPSTPIYHFSNHYALQPGYGASSDNIAGAGTGSCHGEVDYGGSQHGGTQNENPYASSDRLAATQRRSSVESAESRTSSVYLSSDRVTIDPLSPLPGAPPSLPPSQAIPQRTGKDGFIIQNDNVPQLRQHEDGGVRLDVHHPRGPSPRQQVIDLPPVYKPNY